MKQFIKQSLLFFWELFEVAIIAFVSVFMIRTFVVQPFLVKGASMEPNFSHGDYLLVDEISVRFRHPQRGEVIVFRFPQDRDIFYIKRVIGLPGEEVVVRRNGVYIINERFPEGFLLNEAYVREGGVTGEEASFKLGDREYLVMGDNRSYSYDSRTWGPVPEDKIVGLARVRLWPIQDFSLIGGPAY